MKTTKSEIKAFLKSLNKTTKIIILLALPVIISLFSGGVYLQIHMFVNGYSSEIARLSDELIKCCGDTICALFLPAFFIELYSNYN